MQPLHESAEQKVADLGSDDLVLALARAYTLSEIFPVHHPTVQEAIEEVSAQARESIDLEVTSGGIQRQGRAVMDRHGYLREFGRDLRAVGATALRIRPGLDAAAIEFFLRQLRQAQTGSSSDLERNLTDYEVPTIVVAFNGSFLAQPETSLAHAEPETSLAHTEPETSLAHTEIELEDTEVEFADTEFTDTDFEDTEVEISAAAVDAVEFHDAIEYTLDPVDERLDREAVFDDASEIDELFALSDWDGHAVAAPLDGPMDESEWLSAMEHPEVEAADDEVFGETPTLPIEADAVEPLEESEADDDSLADEDAFAEPRLGLASLLPSDDTEQAESEPSLELSSPPPPDDPVAETEDPFLESLPEEAASADEDWDEAGTPMPWEDVGGFWGGEQAEWSSSSDDAFWDSEESEVDEPAAPSTDEPPVSEVVNLALEQDEWPIEDVVAPEALEEVAPEALNEPVSSDSPHPPEGSGAQDDAEGLLAPYTEADLDVAASPNGVYWNAEYSTEEDEPDAVTDELFDAAADELSVSEQIEMEVEGEFEASDPESVPAPDPSVGSELARIAGDLIRTEDDIAQVEAFRAALSDVATPGEVAESPVFLYQQPPETAEETFTSQDGGFEREEPFHADEKAVVPVATLAPEIVELTSIAPPPPAGTESTPPTAQPAAFDLDGYDSFEELACACLSVSPDDADEIRNAVLERGRQLAAEGNHETVADAVAAVLLSPESDPSDVDAFAHRLADKKVVSLLLARLGDAKMADERENALQVVGRLSDLMAPAIAEALSEVPPRPARRNYLDAMFTMGEAAFAESIPMLDDSRWFIVRNGVDIIGETDGLGAIERLAAPLAHPDSRVRRATVMAMAKIGGDQAGSRLLTMFDDPDGDVREAAAMAVGHLRVERGVRPLLTLLDKEKDDDLQMIVLRALGQIGDPAAVPAIEKRALGSFFSKPSTAVRIAAYRALSGMGTPHAGELIRQAASDKNPEVAAAAGALAAQL